MTQHHRTGTGAAGILFGVACAALAGCSSVTTTSATPTATARTTQPAAAVPSPSSSAQQALAAYRAMWAEVEAADQTADYQAPALTNHLTGQALLTITENMAVEQAQGIVALGTPVLHPVVLTASATSVALQDCIDGRHFLEYYAATHHLVDDTLGGFRSTTATVTDIDGAWKVSAIDVRADGTCHGT